MLRGCEREREGMRLLWERKGIPMVIRFVEFLKEKKKVNRIRTVSGFTSLL